MSAPPSGTGEPISGKRELVEHLEQGCKPRAAWRIGTEHEKFGFRNDDLRPPTYEGPRGIGALGAVAGTKGFDVTAAGPEVAGIDKKERKINLKSSGAEVDGDADKKAVQATIRNRMSALQSCYEKALRANTGLTGKITYTITISVMGTVTAVVVLDDSLQDEGVKTCTVNKIKGWRFPTTAGAEASSDVTFSVVFSGT